ncbi:NADH-quinone oxidoreductase subunit L [Proteobacteria bacterium 005FR1]|nr:NADH-quinone oxidoreductase subunit L [Proteobacteria bacterium 005FR1]
MTWTDVTLASLLLLIPAVYVVPALLVRASPSLGSDEKLWRFAEGLALLALGAILFASVLATLFPTTAAAWVLPNALTLIMATLVSFIGLLILRFSRRYLAGDAGRANFLRWYLFTLGAISLFVIVDHLALAFAAWVATSLSLHHLLVYYPDRPKALLAAHKKFFLARLADLALFTAFVLLALEGGSALISDIVPTLAAAESLSWRAELAMVLLALVAILKCAQLPFHGWLLQVMEAPTPVSALLHAGIINVGGFLLLRFAGLLALADTAQWLLVLVATATVLVASITMLTRISIKVMLAWSTCAQMGFMLLEIGLGLYALALLHLVAHSCYKAYSFLNSGETVRGQINSEAGGSRPPLKGWHVFAGSLLAVAGISAVLANSPDWTPNALLVMTVVAVAAATLATESLRYRLGSILLPLLATTLAIYMFNHWLFSSLTDDLFPTVENNWGPVMFAGAAFALLFAFYAALRARPQSRLSQGLYPVIYAGLYLDEWFTRQTLRWWPPSFELARPDHLSDVQVRSTSL